MAINNITLDLCNLITWDEYYSLALEHNYSFRKLANEGVLTKDMLGSLNSYYKKKKKEVELWKLRFLTLDAIARGWLN